MILDQIIKLGEMGFSKADIMSLVGDQAAAPAPAPAPAPVQNEIPVPEPTPVPEPEPTVTLSDDQFSQLIQRMNQANSGIDIPPVQNASDVLTERLNKLFGIGAKEVSK